MKNDFALVSRGFLAVIGVVAGMAVGCAAPVAATTRTTAGTPHPHPHTHNPGDHNHARGKMLMASDGMYNALLTAHLSSKTGNELDVFIENADGPFALKATTLEVTATIGETSHTLSMACAPADERPANETPGTCSHYVAAAPWMKATDTLRAETKIAVGDHEVAMVWRDFNAQKFAHHEE